ncbi:hypothetical protein [Streptomyces sp. NPDC059874]|uniref:hypothetical protein n=1 Tax=Streptomyces sp. NPDC059874 TaxID=3346983 RepID=UPI00366916C3
MDPPRPLPSGAELPVRPGERITVTAKAKVSGDAFNGVRVTSPAFAADGTLRRDDSLLVAVVTVSCSSAPGSYEVRFAPPVGDENMPKIDTLWGSVRVSPADEAEQADCARRVAELPPVSQEEHWPDDGVWPASPWDVRSIQAGGQLKATDGLAMANDGEVTLSSPAFTRPVVMHGAKLASATVQIRCDAKPGLYTVHWNEQRKPAKIWARYRVTPAAPDCHDPAPPQASEPGQSTSWLIGGAVLAAAGAATYLLIRRQRGGSR